MLINEVNYDWQHIFSNYTNNPTHTRRHELDHVSYSIKDIQQVIAIDDGENDGDDWIGLFLMNDGRYLNVRAGCDYTGWGCQESGSCDISDNLLDAVTFGLTQGERDRLKDQLNAVSKL